ncbi:MAG TPA: HIT family protein, partial [Candidatus Saccharimonadales bacterium]|nr:HIT family protein [Candidatus Saccharimonadales bacterium]
MDQTVFEQVWDGTLPSFPIFRSDQHGMQVVLDIYPAHPGHVLVIPREPVDKVFELEPYRYLQLFAVAQAAAQRISDVLQPLRVVHMVSGYDIPHVHLHLLPSFERGDADANLLAVAGRSENRASDEELAAMQARLMLPEDRQQELLARL